MLSRDQIISAIIALVGELKEEKPNKVRYAGPCFGKEEYQAGISALLSGWLCGGQYTLKSEQKLREISNREYSLLVNSGSSANLVGVSALKEQYFQDGDKILTLSCGFPTTVNPITQNNLVPVFVDIDNKLGLDPNVLESCIKEKGISGVFFAHTLGFCGDVDSILDICRKYDVVCAFDCCDAYTTKYKNRPLTSYGKIATYSFYPAHHLTAGGHGGAIVCNDQSLHQTMRGISRWGRFCSSSQCCIRSLPNGRDLFCPTMCYTNNPNIPEDYDVNYRFEWLGYNLQINEVQAAILSEQLNRIDDFDKIRVRNYNILLNWFKENWPECGIYDLEDGISPFSFFFTLPEKTQRKHLVHHLKLDKIETRLLFGGKLQNHSAYKKCKFEEFGGFENSEKIMNRGLMLGVSQILDEEDIGRICESLGKFIECVA